MTILLIMDKVSCIISANMFVGPGEEMMLELLIRVKGKGEMYLLSDGIISETEVHSVPCAHTQAHVLHTGKIPDIHRSGKKTSASAFALLLKLLL